MDDAEIRRKFDELTTNITTIATQLNANKVHRPPSQPLPRLTGDANDLGWDEFLCQIYDMGNANGWTKENYCQYMPQCLSGEAKDVYRLLSKDTQENWEDLTKELGNGIRQLLTKERAQELLASCKQKEGEAPSTFLLRLKKLAERAYPVHKPAAGAAPAPPPAGYWTEEQHNATVVSHFRHGLLPKLHAEVIRRKAETTPHAELQKVIEEDRIQQSIRERQQDHSGSSMTMAAINAISAKVENLASEQEHLRRIAAVRPYRADGHASEEFANSGFPSTFNRRNEPYQQGNYRRQDEDRGRSWSHQRSNNQQQWQREPDRRNHQWSNQSNRGNYEGRNFESNNSNRSVNQDYSRGRSGAPRFQRGRGTWNQTGDRRSGGNYNGNQWQRRDPDERRREPSAGPSGGRRGIGFRLPDFIAVIAILALTSMLPSAATEEQHQFHERQYQICSITKAPVYVSRPIPERCHLPSGIHTVRARVQIYRPRLSQITINAYSCTNVTYVTCGSYFFGIRTSAHNAEPKYNTISAEACWTFAQDANLTEGATNSRAEHDIWTTGRMPSVPDGFMGDACAESWNVIAQRGAVDSKNGIHIESNLMDPTNCTIRDHKCISNGHMVVWKVPDMHVFCSHELAGEFDALVSRSHVLLPPVQSAFVLKPHSEVPPSVQECIGGTVLAAGNDAFIKFLDTLPANVTSPWMTFNATTSPRRRRSTETLLRTGFGSTERRTEGLHFPSTTGTKTLTPAQQLEAVKLKFQAIRAVLSLPSAQAFYNTNVNRLAYDLKQRRLDRQRTQRKWQDAEKAKTVSRSPTSSPWTFDEQQVALRSKQERKPMTVKKTTTTMQTYSRARIPPTTGATFSTTGATVDEVQPPTTGAATTPITASPETPQFPYVEPKIYLAKKATNGSRYFQGTNRKKYWDLKQMPHGSAILEKETDVVHHVFWPSNEAADIRLYRLSRFEHEEAQRQGPRFSPTRRQRHEPEALLLDEIRTKDVLLPAEAQEVYDLWAGLEERAHFNDVLNDFLIEEADYATYEEPAFETETDEAPQPMGATPYEADLGTSAEQRMGATPTPSTTGATRRKRSTNTSKEWDYGTDDENDKAASKHMKNRFNKDLNNTASGEESEEDVETPEEQQPETDTSEEPDPGGQKPPSNVTAEMNQMTRTTNTKLQYAIDTWDISDSENFRHLYQSICEMDANQVRITSFMWTLMPTEAIRYWLRRSDVAAVPAGEALAIYPCTQVLVDEVHWSQKINNTCYDDIPVTLDGKLWFFPAGSRDLRRQSRTVNCSSRTVNIYRNGSTWISTDGHQTHVNKLEHHLKLKHHSLHLNLSAPSLYQSDATEVADRLTRFTNYERRINRLEDIMYAVELRTPATAKDAFTEAGNELKRAFNRTVNAAKQKLENWNPFEGLFETWYHWLIAAGGIILAIASIILLWYCWPAIIICRDCIRSIRRKRQQWVRRRREQQSERRLIELQPVIAAVQAGLKTDEAHIPLPPWKDGATIGATTHVSRPLNHQTSTAPPDYQIATSDARSKKDACLYNYFPEINLLELDSEQERPYITTEITANGRQVNAIVDTGADANLCSTAFLETTKWRITQMTQPLTFGGIATTLQMVQQQAIRMSDGSTTYIRGAIWGTISKDDAEAKTHSIPVLQRELPKPLVIGAPSLDEISKQLGLAKLRYTGKQWKLAYDRPEKGRISRILAEHLKKTKDLESRQVTSPRMLQPDMLTWKHRLYITASLQGEDVTCRWDTGAPRSICKASTAYKLNLSRSTERAPTVRYVNGGLMKVTAVAQTYIEVGHVTSKLSVLVVPDSYYTAAEDMLLGLDWTADVAERCDLIFNLEAENKHLSLDGINVAYGHADSNGVASGTRWRRRNIEYPPGAAVPRLKRTKSYEDLNRKHEELQKDHGKLRQQFEEREEELKKQKQQNRLNEAARTKDLRNEIEKLIEEKKAAEREHSRRLKQVRDDMQQLEQQKDNEMQQTLERKAELLQELNLMKTMLCSAVSERRAAEEAGQQPQTSEELINRIQKVLQTRRQTEDGATNSLLSAEERTELHTLRAKHQDLHETFLQEVQRKKRTGQDNSAGESAAQARHDEAEGVLP
ncbi:Integrase core domain containing protein [Aphelenchoides avenae]|nr:Integrase core domain containing protein [Aphelenchus avenae]